MLRVTHGLRDSLHAALRAVGIGCGVHYVPNHQQPAFTAFTRPLPVTEQLAAEVITLPLHTRLSPVQVERIVAEVSHFLNRAEPASEPQPHMLYPTA